MHRAGGRLIERACLFLFVAAAVFALADLAPGDAATSLGVEQRLPPAAVARWREARGLDRPWPVRFSRWLGRAARGDLGESLTYQAPVTTLVARRAIRTLALGTAALACAWLVALPLGAWLASRPRGGPPRLILASLTVVQIVPDVTLAVGVLLLATATRTYGDGPAWPMATLAVLQLPAVVRHVRGQLADALDAPWARAARARGVPPAAILRRALRVASAPLVALAALSGATLLSASLVVEVVFGWPGLGPLTLEALLARDTPLVVGGVLTSTALLVIATTAADLVTPRLDPRIRSDA